MTADSAFDAWKTRAAATPIATAAVRLKLTLRHVTGRKDAPVEMAGPCPSCGGDDRFSINTRKNVYHCRGCGEGGHGAIDLVMFARRVAFLAACELITGDPPPAREAQVTDEDRARWEREARELQEAAAQRAADEIDYRETERARLFRYWRNALPIAGTPAEGYLELRGLRAPPSLRAKCISDMPYYSGGGDHGEILARAPALVLPLLDGAGVFRGLHLTYIDLSKPKGKLELRDAAGNPLKAKKMRGSVKGNKAEILRHPAPTTLVLGEGLEKTLAVWMALDASGRDLSTAAFWSGCDLGNMAGKAKGSVAHPELRTEKNRAQRVAGPDPDSEDPGIPIPDSVTDLVLLGDSTSDPFTTQCAMYRAYQRYGRDGRRVRVLWAPPEKDFDDVAREEREAA